MSAYDTGILMTNGFSIAAQKPADLKYLADTIVDRDNYVTNNISYEGMLVYVKETKKVYQLIDNTWKEFGFNADEFEANVYDGLDSDSQVLALSARQGKALNTLITTHENSTIHITEEERTTWNAKASTAVATQTANGLMSSSDKTKLDGIATGANNYVHPDTHPASMIVEDSTHRFVTDEEKEKWDNIVDSLGSATDTTDGLMSAEDKAKLDSIEEGANNYVHPDTHPATMIVTDTSNRFVTDEQIAYWNSKPGDSSDFPTATQTANGLLSAEDKAKLDSIEEGANNYVHPTTHPASIIVQDTNNRFVTDTEKATWNAKASTAVATQTANGLMSSSDKTKLDGLSSSVATTTTNGLMSSTDKTNLESLLTRMTAMETQQSEMLAKLKTAVFI